MDFTGKQRWWHACRFALGETWAQRGVQLAQLLPALLWLRLRNQNAPWEGLLGKHLREGKTLSFDEQIKVQLWQGADVCCAVLFVLVLLSPWWIRWSSRRYAAPLHGSEALRTAPLTRSAVLWLCAGLALALAVRWPQYQRTILRDEQDTVRENILGYVVKDENGVMKPYLVDWKTTVWEDTHANNPFLFSILSRLSLRAWQTMTDTEPWRANVFVLRLWALVPGLVSLWALWWSLRLMGHPRAAVIALFLGAIHPMHADYSAQARGYALVMMFASLSLGIGWLAWTHGRWRQWMALAACFFGMLYSNPASVYFVASVGSALACALGWKAFVQRDVAARCNFARLGVCGVLSFLLFVPLVWPAIPQAAGYLNTEMRGSIAGIWPVSTWSKYASGVMMPDVQVAREWMTPLGVVDDRPVLRSPTDYIANHYMLREPLLFTLVFIIVPVVIVAGALSFFRRHHFGRALLAGAIAAPIVTYLLHRCLFFTFLYYWYLIYALPVVLALLGLGLEWMGALLAKLGTRRWLAWLPAAGFAVLFLAVNQGGPGRAGWTQPAFTEAVRITRGRSLWITHPDGTTERVRNSQPLSAPRIEKR